MCNQITKQVCSTILLLEKDWARTEKLVTILLVLISERRLNFADDAHKGDTKNKTIAVTNTAVCRQMNVNEGM